MLKLIDPLRCPSCREEIPMGLQEVREMPGSDESNGGAYTRYGSRCFYCRINVTIDIIVTVDMEGPRAAAS